MAYKNTQAGADLRARPSESAAAVVVATPFAFTCIGLYVGGAGNLTATLADATSVTFTAVAAGTILPIAATNVTAATALNMVALF